MTSLYKRLADMERGCKKVGVCLTSLKSTKKGFTLIELLVVITIIAILSGLVMAALSTSRQKGRDARRISDAGEIQTALELFYDGARSYPSTTPSGFSGTDAAIELLVQQKLLKQVPIPPPGGSPLYIYKGVYLVGATKTECTTVGRICTSYVLGITLERNDSLALKADADQTLGAVFYGNSQDCLTSPAVGALELCYDAIR